MKTLKFTKSLFTIGYLIGATAFFFWICYTMIFNIKFGFQWDAHNELEELFDDIFSWSVFASILITFIATSRFSEFINDALIEEAKQSDNILVMDNFTKSEDVDDIYNFVASANFAFKAIKAGDISKAKSYDAYLFANDNKYLDQSLFAILTGKLIPQNNL